MLAGCAGAACARRGPHLPMMARGPTTQCVSSQPSRRPPGDTMEPRTRASMYCVGGSAYGPAGRHAGGQACASGHRTALRGASMCMCMCPLQSVGAGAHPVLQWKVAVASMHEGSAIHSVEWAWQ